jgi:(hydroxyamino)benzene mutase
MDDSKRRLLWHGALLFLLGLITGLFQMKFANVRMALAAHLEGVMNGTFLIAVGAVWHEVTLSARAKSATWWLLLFGTYANWAFTCLAAHFGTAALSPVTGAGHAGEPWQETLITAGFTSVGIGIIAATVLLLVGLRRRQAS